MTDRELCYELSPESRWPCVLDLDDPHAAGHESAYHGVTRAVWASTGLEAGHRRFKTAVPYWTTRMLDAMDAETTALVDENQRMRDLLHSVARKITTGRPITVEETDLLRAVLDDYA